MTESRKLDHDQGFHMRVARNVLSAGNLQKLPEVSLDHLKTLPKRCLRFHKERSIAVMPQSTLTTEISANFRTGFGAKFTISGWPFWLF